MSKDEKIEALFKKARELGFKEFMFIAVLDSELCHTGQGFNLVEALGVLELHKRNLIKMSDDLDEEEKKWRN